MRDLNNEWLGVLLDPFGMRTLGRMTRYFSVAEANAGLPPFSGFLLLNRALWCGVALLMVAATLVLFKPQRADTGRKWFGKAASPAPAAAPQAAPLRLPRHMPRSGWRSTLAQGWQWLCFDAKSIFTGIPFLVMLLLGLANFLGSVAAGASFFGTEVYPVTRVMLDALNGSYSFLLLFITVFYAGELIFKERQAKMADGDRCHADSELDPHAGQNPGLEWRGAGLFVVGQPLFDGGSIDRWCGGTGADVVPQGRTGDGAAVFTHGTGRHRTAGANQ